MTNKQNMWTGVEKKCVIKQHKDHMSDSSTVIWGGVGRHYRDQHHCQEVSVLFIIHWPHWWHFPSADSWHSTDGCSYVCS